MKFCEYLLLIKNKYKLTSKRLSSLLQVSNTTTKNYLRGDTIPEMNRIFNLINELKLPSSEFSKLLKSLNYSKKLLNEQKRLKRVYKKLHWN